MNFYFPWNQQKMSNNEKKTELWKKGKKILKELEVKCRIKKIGLLAILVELKQKVIAKSAKIKRYEQWIVQFK